MKKILCICISVLMLFCSMNLTITANDIANDDNVIADVVDGDERAVIIKGNNIGEFKLEYYKNNILVSSATTNILKERNNTTFLVYLANYDGVFLQADAEWGYFIPNKYNHTSIACPSSYVEENEVPVRAFDVDDGVDDNFVTQFKLRVEDFIDLEADVADTVNQTIFSSVISAVVFCGAVYFGNPKLAAQAAIEMVEVVHSVLVLSDLIEYMAELQDEMAFYYVSLYKIVN